MDTDELLGFLLVKIKAGGASPSQIKQYVEEYLAEHPVEISQEDGNIMEQKEDGFYVPETDLTNYAKSEDVVEKKNGFSLVADTEIERLAEVDNYDDTEIKDNFNTLVEKVAQIELFKFPNAIIHGEPIINNGQISGFSENNYLAFPGIFDLHGRGFELKLAFTTKDDVTTPQNILGGKYCMALFIQSEKLTLRVSSNGTTWNLVDKTANQDILVNTTYYAKIVFDRLVYKLLLSTDDVNYVEVVRNATGDISPHPSELYIGIGNNFNNPFKGIVNLNKCHLRVNQSIIWQGMDDAGLATRLAIDLANIDEDGIEAIKEIIAAEQYARQSEIPTKVSELENDENYVKEEELPLGVQVIDLSKAEYDELTPEEKAGKFFNTTDE